MTINGHIERLDAHGLTFWLPPMPTKTAAEIARQDVAEVVANAADANEVLELLNIRGYSLVLKVNHHAPQDFREWSLSARHDTWASARLAEASA